MNDLYVHIMNELQSFKLLADFLANSSRIIESALYVSTPHLETIT